MDFNKNLPHFGIDAVAAKKVYFHCFDKNGDSTPRYFEPREIGGAFLLNRIEEKFAQLQEENPHYVSYSYTIYNAQDNPITLNCSNPLTPIRIGRDIFLKNIKKRGGGLFFHDKPEVNQIDTF